MSDDLKAKTAALPEPVKETSLAALKKLGWSFAIVVGVAIAQAVAAFLPHVADTITLMLPGTLVFLAPAIKAGLLAVAAYLTKLGKTDHVDAVDEAYKTEAPASSDDKFYGK